MMKQPEDFNELWVALACETPELTPWVNRGIQLSKDMSNHQWAIADWMVEGEKQFGKKAAYDFAERATGFSRKTLYEWAYVARAVSIRMENLTFGHHQAVAGLVPEAQKRCLEKAAAENLPIGDLRDVAFWQPQIISRPDTTFEGSTAKIPVRVFQQELEVLQISAQMAGFKDDVGTSAIGLFIRKILTEYITAHPDLARAALELHTAGRDAARALEGLEVISR